MDCVARVGLSVVGPVGFDPDVCGPDRATRCCLRLVAGGAAAMDAEAMVVGGRVAGHAGPTSRSGQSRAAMLLVVCRPRQLAWRFAVSLVGLGRASLPHEAGGVGSFSSITHGMPCWSGRRKIRHFYRDAWTIWELIQQPSPQGYMLLQLGTAALVLALCWRHRSGATGAGLQDREKSALTFALALWTGWQLLFGPGTERNTFGLIAPLGAWAVLLAWQQQRGRLLIGLSFLLTTVATFGVIERALVAHCPAVLATHPIGVLLFIAWLLCYGVKTPATDGERQPTEGTQPRADDDVAVFSARTSGAGQLANLAPAGRRWGLCRPNSRKTANTRPTAEMEPIKVGP